jgi:hypothetical protein
MCEINIKQVINEGKPFSKVFKYVKFAMFGGFLVGMLVVRYFIQVNKRKEYMKFRPPPI